MGLFGSIGKALFGGKKKTTSNKSSATTTTQQSQVQGPYGPAVPYVNDYLGQTADLYRNQPLFSPMELQGFSDLSGAVNAGNADIANAAGVNNAVARGDYLTPDTNPFLADIARRISGIAGSNASASFGSRGRTGSGLAGYYHGKAVGDSLTDLFGSEYEAERGRQMQALGMAPTLAASRLVGPQALMQTGELITDRPLNRNLQYGGILGSIAGLGGTTDTTGTGTVNSTSQNFKQSKGLLGKIFDSTINKLFGI